MKQIYLDAMTNLTDDERIILSVLKEVEIERCPGSGASRHLDWLLQGEYINEKEFLDWEITERGQKLFNNIKAKADTAQRLKSHGLGKL